MSNDPSAASPQSTGGGSPRRFLVTGAAGFVGSHLVERLSREGWSGRALVRDRNRVTILQNLPGVELIEGDICDPRSLEPALAGIDTIFHCAALLGPPTLHEDRYREVNVVGTRNVLAAARRAGGLQRFVHLSSVAAVGPSPDNVELTEESPPAPAERYGRSKLASEQVVAEAAGNALPCVIVRPGWVYGPRSHSTAKLMNAIHRRRFFLIGRATNAHQPLYIDDLVEALLCCATNPAAVGRCYNLVGPERTTVRRMAETIGAVLQRSLPPVHAPVWLFRTAALVAETLGKALRLRPPLTRRQLDFFLLSFLHSGQRAHTELGWKARTGFREGITATAKWFHEQRG